MESLMNDLRRNGDDLTTAPSLRLNSRPLHGIFEDHGQTLVSQQSGRIGIKPQIPGTQKFKPAPSTEKSKVAPATGSKTHGSARTTIPDIEFSDSDDEMDLLSSLGNQADDHSTSQKLISHTKDTAVDGFRDENGVWHQYDERFRPKANVLSTLKFNKRKPADNANGTFTDTTPSQPTSTLPALQPSKNGNPLSSSSNPKFKPSTVQGDTFYVKHRPLSSKDPNSKPEGRSQPSSVKLPPRPSEPKLVAEEVKVGPPGRRHHLQIKQINNAEGAHRQSDESSTSKRQPSFPVGGLLDFDDHTSTKRPSRSSGLSRSRSRSRCSSTSVKIRKPQAFPILSPPTSPALPKRQPDNFPHISPLVDFKSQKSDLPRPKKRQADSFPLLSPSSQREESEESRGRTRIKRIKGKRKTKENSDSDFVTEADGDDDPGLTMMVSNSVKNNGKGKARALPTKSAKEITKRKPKRFPMSAQILQSIDSSPIAVSSRGGKRLSEGSGDERMSKRSKKENAFLQSPTSAFEEEGDSLLFSPEVDPRSLCPYCDTPLPEKPSSLLLDLLANTKKKAISNPRPSNPLGLKAPVAVFVTVCQRHCFESEILPEAEKKRWPKTIEWSKVANRVLRMKNVLQALIDDPGDGKTGNVASSEGVDDDWEIPFCKTKPKEIQKQKGPKADNIFWNELIQEIKEKGYKVVAGVRGQFANFEKAQPGYYGEQGSVIIHQTLYDMFPPGSIDVTLISPLTGNEFLEKILVPEVALRLIMEDRKLEGEDGKREALTVLRESSSYGVSMFPEDGEELGGGRRRRKAEDNQLGVGDMIVMQRAMKRRKELEEEGKAEEENERTMQTKLKREASRKIPPKPRPLGKASSAMSICSSQDELSRPRSRPTKQIRGDCEDTDPVSGIETSIEISESDSDGGRPESVQPSSSANDSRSSLRSTSRAISGLNLSDTDASTKAVVGARPATWSRSFSRKMANHSSKMDPVFEDIMKTPVPASRNAGSGNYDTPKVPKSPQNRATPPLMRARRRHNKDSTLSSRQNSGTPKPPQHAHLAQGASQDSRWLLEDDESS